MLQVGLYFSLGPGQADRLHLPLDLDQSWWQDEVATGTHRWGLLHFRGQDYLIRIWIGRTASARARTALMHALASVRPAQ